MHKPIVIPIKKIETNTPSIKTFFMKVPLIAQQGIPGQFIMVWTFNDEIPMSLSYIDPKKELIGITVKKVGSSTEMMHSMSEGSLGVRGPYGNGFKIAGSRILVVGGGVGMACLFPLILQLIKSQKSVTVLIGAVTKEELLFQNSLQEYTTHENFRLSITTDDGSMGFHGLVTELMDETLQMETFDQIYACGPEPMLKTAFNIAESKNITFQASLERFMKCGIGLCGSCCINEQIVCKDGPIFESKALRTMNEFGHSKRDPSGKLISITD
ncbi:MAG: dihydroorotate dehydrogenase electron transfer subunit [Promethearchaeota archaeon]